MLHTRTDVSHLQMKMLVRFNPAVCYHSSHFNRGEPLASSDFGKSSYLYLCQRYDGIKPTKELSKTTSYEEHPTLNPHATLNLCCKHYSLQRKQLLDLEFVRLLLLACGAGFCFVFLSEDGSASSILSSLFLLLVMPGNNARGKKLQCHFL